MKPDGVTMETTETTEAAAVAEPSNPPDNSTEQSLPPPEEATSDGAPKSAATVNGKAAAKPTATKKQPPTASGSRPPMTSRRPMNEVKPSNNVAAKSAPVKKPPAPSARPPGAAAMPKKTQMVSSGSTSTTRTQVKLPNKKPSGPAAAATAMSDGSKPANGTPKKTLASAKPKTTGPVPRTMGSTAPKPGSSTSTKPDASSSMKTTRPATALATSRAATKPSTAAGTTKPSSTVRTTASRAATAPPSGRAMVAPPNKAAKKDVSRPPAVAAVAKKPPPATAIAKKTEISKSAGNVKPSMASTTTKIDAKLPPKPQQTIKPNATKKPAVAAARFPAVNRIGQTPPGSPIGKSPSTSNTPRSKIAHKPTQAVSPFTASKKTERMGTAKAAAAASNKAGAVAAAGVAAMATAGAAVRAGEAVAVAEAGAAEAEAAVVQDTQVEPVTALPQEQSPAPESSSDPVASISVQSTALETVEKGSENNTDSTTEESPLRTASSQIEQQQLCALSQSAHGPTPAASHVFPVASPLQPENISPVTETQMSDHPKLMLISENDSPVIISPNNLNEDEEEEEKEGSQLVSVSEMSGTTQPTEDSRPGSAGPVGASAWRVGGGLLSELDSEEVSVSQQGASELSAPGVLEGTESMDDLGEGSLKGAMDMEGASAGSPDFERVPEIPVNDYDEDDEDDDNDRVCDMDVGSERADDPQRHDNDVDDEEDEDVEMASEGVTESGLESYGNADEDDFAEDERLDNLNRVAEPPPPPPLIPSAPAAQWDQPNPFSDPWAEPVPLQPPEADSHSGQGTEAAAESPMTDPCQGDSETPTQESAQAWMELGSVTVSDRNQEDPQNSGIKEPQTPEPQLCLEQSELAAEATLSVAALCAPGSSPLRIISSGTTSPEEPNDIHSPKDVLAPQPSPQPELAHREEPEGTPADELPASANAPASNPSSSSVTEDEASDTEGEAQLEESLETLVICNVTFDNEPHSQRCLSTVEEGEEPEDSGAAEDATPPSATSQVSYGFDTTTSASNSNAQSTGESCVKSPGIFSLEELPEEAKEPPLPPAPPNLSDQPYIECGKQHVDSEPAVEDKIASPDKVFALSPEPQQVEQMHSLVDLQPPYYSAICEKTENFAGFTALLHPQRRDHSSYLRTYCDIVKPVHAALASPKLSCTDLPPRSPKQQSLSPQLRRLEQHQRHLQELQQRREQQSRPIEEAEQERKRREEEEERKKKDEAEEEIKRNKEEQERRLREQEEAEKQELQQRQELELQLHQQQEELKQRQQIMQWQQELQESNKGQPLLLSPSSGLCTIYEALEQDDEEEAKCDEEIVSELNSVTQKGQEVDSGCGRVTPETHSTHSPRPPQNTQQRLNSPTQNGDSFSSPPESPERPSPPPLDLEWGKKVDIVHQLINQTLLLNGDGCSSLLLLPGGAGGTLSPLESSLWPTLLPPLTPPSATVTSVSSFSPETSGTSSQGEWTVVELETHH